MLGMKGDTLNRMLLAIVITAVAAVGMSIPTNAQEQDQQHKQKQEKQLVQYRQQLQRQDRLWTQRSALLQQQRRTAQYRFQQGYLERRRQQILDQNARSYDYNSDPNF
jgi:hypothetical protein